MYPWGAIVALSGTLSFCHLVSTEFSEGTDVDEQNFVEMDELPDDDPVQCGSEFCVICNELATKQR